MNENKMDNKIIKYKPKITWKFKKAYLDVLANELKQILEKNHLEHYKTGYRDTFYMYPHDYPGDVHVYEKDNPDNVIYRFGDNRIFTQEKHPLPKREVLGSLAINLTDYIFGEGMGIKNIIKEHKQKKEIRITRLKKLDEVIGEIVGELNDKEVFK